MPQDLALPLREAVTSAVPRLRALSPEQWTERPPSGGWSRKEELGHLLDSAANNRMRFVRAALHGESRDPGYEQNAWVMQHNYTDLDVATLLGAWENDNLVLAHLLAQIPESSLDAPCYVADKPAATLRYIAENYVWHMQHHVGHILREAA